MVDRVPVGSHDGRTGKAVTLAPSSSETSPEDVEVAVPVIRAARGLTATLRYAWIGL